MRVLAIDSATNMAGVALVGDEAVIGETISNTGKTHSQRLLPMIAYLLEEAELELADLDGIVISGGPGSFTGLRIGMATAKGLAYASQKPLVTVSTLDSLALNMVGYPGLICPILNARKNEVYTALYRCKLGEKPEVITPYQVLKPTALIELLTNQKDEVVFLGDGVPVFGSSLLEGLGSKAKLAFPLESLPRAANLGWLGVQRLKEGQVADLESAKPYYIRSSEAEVKWQQKNR